MPGSNKFFYAFAWVMVAVILLVSMLGDASELVIAFKFLIIALGAFPLRREIIFLAKKLAKGTAFAMKALGGHVRETEERHWCKIVRMNGERCGQSAMFAIRTVVHDHDERAPYIIAGATIFCCRMHHPNPLISGDRAASLETERFLKHGNAAWEGVYPLLTRPTIGA